MFTENAWEDYLFWQRSDRKMVRKINQLLKDISRNPIQGTGRPEALKYDLAGFWSRRIDHEHRLVYKVHDQEILVYACRHHYD